MELRGWLRGRLVPICNRLTLKEVHRSAKVGVVAPTHAAQPVGVTVPFDVRQFRRQQGWRCEKHHPHENGKELIGTNHRAAAVNAIQAAIIAGTSTNDGANTLATLLIITATAATTDRGRPVGVRKRIEPPLNEAAGVDDECDLVSGRTIATQMAQHQCSRRPTRAVRKGGRDAQPRRRQVPPGSMKGGGRILLSSLVATSKYDRVDACRDELLQSIAHACLLRRIARDRLRLLFKQSMKLEWHVHKILHSALLDVVHEFSDGQQGGGMASSHRS
jgi:hypothetical protein